MLQYYSQEVSSIVILANRVFRNNPQISLSTEKKKN